MAFCWTLSLIILLQICYTETYDDWEVYNYKDQRRYVMYQSKKLNKYYKDKFPDNAKIALGLHVSVFPKYDRLVVDRVAIGDGKFQNIFTAVPKGKPGKDVHSSWNTDADGDRVNDFHWGWVSGKWYPTNRKDLVLKEGGKREDMAILKHVWDEFVKNGYKPPDGARIDMFDPANLKQAGKDKANTLLQYPKRQPPPAAPAADAVVKASIDYYDNYDEYSASQISTHMEPKRHSHLHHHDNEDTDSSSISIPTVFVTLISCMFLFVVCAVYTGCIGLIAAAIGYKMKQSEQTSKVQSFEEI